MRGAETGRAALVLFLFWLVVSGSLDPVDLILGAVLAVLLGHWAVRALWTGRAPFPSARQLGRLAVYLVTLLRTVVAAALHVARLVLDRRLPVEPLTLTYRTGLRGELARVALANSLTLTPGTLTLDVDGDVLHVHCLAPGFAEHVVDGRAEQRVARVFEPE